VYQKTGKCRDCGVDIGRHCLRCKGCATRERNRLKRACRERNEESYVPAWRCPKCGNKIRTEVCYGCEVEQKQEALVWARKLFLGVNSRENLFGAVGIRKPKSRKPKRVKGTTKKSKKISGTVHSKDTSG
jgi:hypothetical protein